MSYYATPHVPESNLSSPGKKITAGSELTVECAEIDCSRQQGRVDGLR